MLRPYQQDCLEKLLWARESCVGNNLVSLAQGAGKSHIIAAYAEAIKEPVLILQPSRELVEQNVDKMKAIVDKKDIGVFSASLQLKEIKKFTFATIGSVYKHPEMFVHFKNVILDECHMLNVKRQKSMLVSFLSDIGDPHVIGLTATPYRQVQQAIRHNEYWIESITMTKMINRMLPKFWERLLYTISTQELIDLGFLVPLTYIDKTIIKHENIPTNKSKSDFDLTKYEQMIKDKDEDLVYALEKAQGYFRSTLVFCSSVEQAERLSGQLKQSEVVTGTTPAKQRKAIVANFKKGHLKTVFNVGCLTTGFDHPGLDLIVLLRPTRSIGLYLQMLGRGSRICPDLNKKTCAVLDFTDTVKQLGQIETFKVTKVDGKWDIVSDKGPWHGKPLYKFMIESHGR